MSKFRNWRLTSYLNFEQILSILDEHSSQIKAYAFILHDKDVDVDGIQKVAHYHILLSLFNATSLSGVLSWFKGFDDEYGNEINTLGKVMNNRKGAFDYLTHNTCASQFKYQYSEGDIVSFNAEFFLNTDDNIDTLSCALQDMLDGVPLDYIRRRYGRDFILHYCHIKALYNDIQKQLGGVLL